MRVNQRYFALRDADGRRRALVRLRRQHPGATDDGAHHHRRQRARAARPLRRCAAFLGPRPQGPAGNPGAGARQASHSMPSWAPRATGCAGWSRWPRLIAPRSAPTWRWPGAPRCCARPTHHRHGRRVPRAAGRHGPLLRPARRRGPRRSPTPSATITRRRARPTRFRPRPVAHRRGAGGQARPAGGVLRRRREADRLGRSLCAAPGGAGHHPDHSREPASPEPAGADRRSRGAAADPGPTPTNCSPSSPNACACSFAPRAPATTSWPPCSARDSTTISFVCSPAPMPWLRSSAPTTAPSLLAAYRRAANILRIEERQGRSARRPGRSRPAEPAGRAGPGGCHRSCRA